jgi:hypothetical protein
MTGFWVGCDQPGGLQPSSRWIIGRPIQPAPLPAAVVKQDRYAERQGITDMPSPRTGHHGNDFFGMELQHPAYPERPAGMPPEGPGNGSQFRVPGSFCQAVQRHMKSPVAAIQWIVPAGTGIRLLVMGPHQGTAPFTGQCPPVMVPWHQHPVPAASMLVDDDPPEFFRAFRNPDPVFGQGKQLLRTRFQPELEYRTLGIFPCMQYNRPEWEESG